MLIVDGMALLFRAYYASAASGYIQRTSQGTPTNAVHGFVKYLLDAVKTFSPSHVVCCWDLGSRTFRTELYPAYKGNRPEPPDDLVPQFDLIKDVVDCFNVPNIGITGYEADDCIGTLARKFSEELDVVILTGDQDLLQLVSDRIRVAIMKKGVSNYAVFDLPALLAEKMLAPEQIVDLKGLVGDTSDNYPGVRGIGEKTAVKLLQQYRTIEGILERLDELPAGVRKKIEADLDMLQLSRDLARIRCDVPISCPIESCRWRPDPERIREMFAQLEFKSLMRLIG
jgi:5'-3' exonuclease